MASGVRIAQPDDLQAVLDVHAHHGNRPDGPPSQAEEETWGRMMSATDLAVYVIEVEGAVVGTATAMQMPNVTYGCAPTVFIEAVVVQPAYRRRGLATEMLRRVIDDARVVGCNKIQLLSHKRHTDDGAHDLYAKVGFTAEAEGFRLYLAGRPAHIPHA